MRTKQFSIIAVLFMVLLLTSCATKTIQQNLYASLDSTITVYNTTYDIVKDLDAKGEIKAEDKPIIQEMFKNCEAGLKTASDVLHIYVMSPNSTNQEIFNASIIEVMDILSQIKEFIYNE